MPANIEGKGQGGIHPGRPVALPPTTVPIARIPGAVEVKPPARPIIRPLTIEDIRSHLLSLQIQDTDSNVKLASLMLRYGLAVSKENMTKALQYLEGTSKSSNLQEAILILLSKGIDSPQAVRILSDYLAQNPQLAQQILVLQEAIANLQNALGILKGLNPNLLSQIAALVTQFDQSLSKLPESYRFGRNSSISRKNLVDDIRGLKTLLEGLGSGDDLKNMAPAEKGMLFSSITSMMGKLGSMLDNLIAQAILSQPAKNYNSNDYLYHQIPNSLADPPQTVEIIIKRDGSNSGSIDPANTQLIMSLDTPNLGKLSIAMDVKEKNVKFLFNTENEEARSLISSSSDDLKASLADKNYVLKGFQAKVNKAMCSIKPYLIPLLRLDDFITINLMA